MKVSFIHLQMKTNFHMKEWAPGLALKKRLTVIRKWRIKRLELVENFKYLGVLLDQTLSWKDHIDYIGSKISSRLGVLRRARKVLPKATCLLLYNTLILP